jgi:HEAT repeat protein
MTDQTPKQAEDDMRSTYDVIQAALAFDRDVEEQHEAYWDCVHVLHVRGGREEFEAGRALLCHPDPAHRELGASVLAQLGCTRGSEPTFVDESVALLVPALNDQAVGVVSSAAHALAHRRSPLAIPHLLPLIDHPNEDVRYAVTHGLSCHNDRRATDALIQLCHDTAEHVRDWASFGLAEMCSLDYPELLAELHRQLLDENPEIRGQALRGLAERGDRSCLDALCSELTGEFNGTWAIDAAGVFADPSLLDALATCRGRMGSGAPDYFYDHLDEAVEACRTRSSTRDKGRG